MPKTVKVNIYKGFLIKLNNLKMGFSKFNGLERWPHKAPLLTKEGYGFSRGVVLSFAELNYRPRQLSFYLTHGLPDSQQRTRD